MPRDDPLRAIVHDLDQNDLRSLITMVICFVRGIRLPLFDEPNPYPFQVLKRAFGFPKEMELPRGTFDLFPAMHEQLLNALSKATTDELEGAKAACRFLSRLLDNPENWRRGHVVVSGLPLPRRPIKLFSLICPSPIARAVTVALIVVGMRAVKSMLGEEGAAAAFALVASQISVLSPEFA